MSIWAILEKNDGYATAVNNYREKIEVIHKPDKGYMALRNGKNYGLDLDIKKKYYKDLSSLLKEFPELKRLPYG